MPAPLGTWTSINRFHVPRHARSWIYFFELLLLSRNQNARFDGFDNVHLIRPILISYRARHELTYYVLKKLQLEISIFMDSYKSSLIILCRVNCFYLSFPKTKQFFCPPVPQRSLKCIICHTLGNCWPCHLFTAPRVMSAFRDTFEESAWFIQISVVVVSIYWRAKFSACTLYCLFGTFPFAPETFGRQPNKRREGTRTSGPGVSVMAFSGICKGIYRSRFSFSSITLFNIRHKG